MHNGISALNRVPFFGYLFTALLFGYSILGLPGGSDFINSNGAMILVLEFIAMHSLFFTAGFFKSGREHLKKTGWAREDRAHADFVKEMGGSTNILIRIMHVLYKLQAALQAAGVKERGGNAINLVLIYAFYSAFVGIFGIILTKSYFPLLFFVFSSGMKLISLKNDSSPSSFWAKEIDCFAVFMVSVIISFTAGMFFRNGVMIIGIWGLLYFATLAALELFSLKIIPSVGRK